MTREAPPNNTSIGKKRPSAHLQRQKNRERQRTCRARRAMFGRTSEARFYGTPQQIEMIKGLWKLVQDGIVPPHLTLGECPMEIARECLRNSNGASQGSKPHVEDQVAERPERTEHASQERTEARHVQGDLLAMLEQGQTAISPSPAVEAPWPSNTRKKDMHPRPKGLFR